MKISLSQLKYYVDIDTTVEDLCNKMTLAGFEIEEIIDMSESMDNVVVGKILEITPHPDSDHLQICSMDVGEAEPVQIITGAQNISVGDLVPAALHNSHLPNGMHIKKGKLRGLPSNGMLCSGEELCLKDSDYPGAEVYGIMILNEEYPTGTDMRDVLHLDDFIVDFKITANRPDCNSVLGVAREIGVVLDKEVRIPKPEYKTVGGDIKDEISVRVENFDLCPRYIGRVVKNLRIKESPDWMKRCLNASGMRPINNIVDITNFVMLETGQPMHAFDLNQIKGKQIIVRNAKDDEKITTLDGKDHTLNSSMLVIADGEEPSCIAGIMGGQSSEIEDTTTDLFFESAKFKRDSVRKTARTLGMRTESSARFEKGIDIMNTEYAMNRALQLIYDLDAGDIVEGVIDEHKALYEEKILNVSVPSINALLGLNIPADTMVTILNNLSIKTTLNGEMLTCVIPSHREDIEGRADIAEEVMRIYGYNHMEGTTMRGAVIRGKLLPERIKTNNIKSALVARGMQEIATYSFISSGAIETLNLDADDSRRNAVKLLNPLGDEYSTMRTQLVTSMLTVISTNYNRKNESARFFEASKVFTPKSIPVTEQPTESPALILGLYGDNEDFYTLKGLVEDVLSQFDVKTTLERASEPYLHPGRQAKVLADECEIVKFGEVHPEVCAKYDIECRVYIAEFDLEKLFSFDKPTVIYKQLPKFPAVTRDLALICDRDLPVGKIGEAIETAANKLLEKLELFDVYTGEQIDKDKKSVAYSMTLRAADRTLTDDEAENTVNKVLKALSKIGAELRQ